MNDREKWRGRVRDIHACGTTWWWWHLIYMYKEDSAFNNLQWLICHKTQPTKSYVFNIYVSIFTNLSAWAGYDTRSIFKRSLQGLNSEFSFSLTSCLTKAEEPSLSYYLPIAGGRIIGFIPFPKVLVQCEMQSALSRIWTRVYFLRR